MTIRRLSPRWRHRPERPAGQALAEFALVIPIFLLMLFGLVDVGRLIYVKNALSEGSREGSRYGSVQSRSSSSSSRDAVGSHTATTLTAVPAPTVTVTCQRESSIVSTCRSGDVLVVRVTSEVEMMTPVIGQLIGSFSLAAQSSVRVQQ